MPSVGSRQWMLILVMNSHSLHSTQSQFLGVREGMITITGRSTAIMVQQFSGIGCAAQARISGKRSKRTVASCEVDKRYFADRNSNFRPCLRGLCFGENDRLALLFVS